MSGVAKKDDDMALSAVWVAELVHGGQYDEAVNVLRILAERAEAAEAACFVAQILHHKPEYKTQIVDLLTLNLQRLGRRAYAHDAGYQQYIVILYQEAARGLAKISFTTEAELLLVQLKHYSSTYCLDDVLCASYPENNILSQPDERDVFDNINGDMSSEQPIKNNDVLEIREERLDDVVLAEEETIVAPDVPVLEPVNEEVKVESITIEPEDVNPEDLVPVQPTIEVAQIKPEPELSVAQVAEGLQPETLSPELKEEPTRQVSPQPVESTPQSSNYEKININKILNINSDEIDKHFEQIKQITAEAVKKAEVQAEKLKEKVRSQKITAFSLNKIKEIGQSTSVQTAIAPAMQKIKSFAKFWKKEEK